MSDRVIVVFDVNVYLNAAEALTEPFRWADLTDKIAEHYSDAGNAKVSPQIDALRCIALASSGRLAGDVLLEVWTSDHIDALVKLKAMQPSDESLDDEDCGLGWSPENAEALLDDLVWRVVDDSSGGTIGNVWRPRETPPLSHEDGLVYATARDADADDVLCRRFVVTSDRGFLKHCGDPEAYPRALSPAQFVQLVRSARQVLASNRMRGIV